MINEEQKNKINRIANEVHDISTACYLSHTVMACEKKIQKEIETNLNYEINKLKTNLKASLKEDKRADVKQICNEIDSLMNSAKSKRFRIFVDYTAMNVNSARTIRIDNNLEIVLPRDLLNKEDSESLKKLRSLLAHELGHVMLHSKEISTDYNTRGTMQFRDEEKELQADYFSEKIIELKSKHYKNVLETGAFI